MRSARELATLAEAIDSVLAGDLTSAAELLMQRFKSVETAAYVGNFHGAQHLEVIRPDKVTCVGGRERELARLTEKEDATALGRLTRVVPSPTR